MDKQNIGTVIQIIGPVLDIKFPDGQLPQLLNAITVQNGEETITLEGAQHGGATVARGGAGGGGFLQVVLKKGVEKARLHERLKEVFQDSDIDVWDSELV